MIAWVVDAYVSLRVAIADQLLLPLLYDAGLMHWADRAVEWIDFFLLGWLHVIVSVIVCAPLEAWRPVERWPDSGPVWTDVIYNLLVPRVLFPLVAFVAFQPAIVGFEAMLADGGFITPTLETLVPWLAGAPVVAFAVYVVILDFADYWRHRLQHSLPWWWALHSVHHAQRQMTFWTDDRNHVLDDLIAALWFSAVAVVIGVPPGQFPLIVLLLRLVEAISHANVRLTFGRVGGRLVVSPHFHRVHHAIDHAQAPFDRVHGCNFGVLLPVWDMVFGTARWGGPYPATGDATASEVMATGGWWATQAEGAKRLVRALAGRAA